MASSYSDILRIEKMADGEKNNTWGQITNVNLELIEDAIAGIAEIDLTLGDVTLTTNSGSADEARCAILNAIGTLSANRNIIIPAKSKSYIVKNDTTGSYTVSVKTATGAAAVVPQGYIIMVLCDGADTFQIFNDRLKVGKSSIWIPARAMEPAPTNGCDSLAVTQISAGKPSVMSLDFGSTAAEYAEFEVTMPNKWNEGTLTYRAYWTTTASDTTGVAWQLQAVSAADNEAFDAAYGTAVVVIDNVQNAASRQLISDESTALTVAGTPAAGEKASFRVSRDPTNGSDTMAVDAKLVGIMLFYTTDAGDDA